MSEEQSQENLVTIAEAAKLLSINQDSVIALIRADRLSIAKYNGELLETTYNWTLYREGVLDYKEARTRRYKLAAENFRFGIQRRIYNWTMRNARMQKGLTQKQLGALVGVGAATIGHYEGFRSYPAKARAIAIGMALDVHEDILFPEWIREFTLQRVPSISEDLHFSLENVLRHQRQLLESSTFEDITSDEVIRNTVPGVVGEVMKTLTDRESKVLKLRFGFDDDVSRTLRKTGEEFGVTPERIRQIQEKGFRKLRHNSRARRLRDYIQE